ncbi:MAG: hypothetical protein QOJ59_179 [Thermomicrobiales bacterium]|jgi:hypothetical protein|nr:hypothetical protein [Thermomicrobiales bacterium]
MYQWRVTKYDPRRRDRRGRYRGDDWTAASDVGGAFDGQTLSLEDYLSVEDQYVATAMHFLRESGLDGLMVVDLESRSPDSLPDESPLPDVLSAGPPLAEGQRLSGADLERAIRLNLRSLLWCKLEEPGRFFIHFGHDYYMYIGSAVPCPESIAFAHRVGLFVEEMESPYNVATG